MLDMGITEPSQDESWISDEELPDPKPLPKMMTYHVLVRPMHISGDYKTKSGVTIYMSDKTKQDINYLVNVGKILAIGPTAFYDNERERKYGLRSECPQVGDYVSWGKMVGKKIMYQGVNLVVLNDDQIMMKVENPRDLDTSASYFGRPNYTPPTE